MSGRVVADRVIAMIEILGFFVLCGFARWGVAGWRSFKEWKSDREYDRRARI
jgi:hypothetical protein